jgi:hypothetical protein
MNLHWIHCAIRTLNRLNSLPVCIMISFYFHEQQTLNPLSGRGFILVKIEYGGGSPRSGRCKHLLLP